jgi:hypothetical protein
VTRWKKSTESLPGHNGSSGERTRAGRCNGGEPFLPRQRRPEAALAVNGDVSGGGFSDHLGTALASVSTAFQNIICKQSWDKTYYGL